MPPATIMRIESNDALDRPPGIARRGSGNNLVSLVSPQRKSPTDSALLKLADCACNCAAGGLADSALRLRGLADGACNCAARGLADSALRGLADCGCATRLAVQREARLFEPEAGGIGVDGGGRGGGVWGV